MGFPDEGYTTFKAHRNRHTETQCTVTMDAMAFVSFPSFSLHLASSAVKAVVDAMSVVCTSVFFFCLC